MLQVTGVGTIRAMTSTGQTVLLTNVVLVPQLAASLISLTKLLQAGMHIEGKGNIVCIHECGISNLNFVLKEDLFLTIVSITDTNELALYHSYNVKERKDATTLTWHERLGHMSHSYMKHLVQHKLALGKPLSKVSDFTCEDCHFGENEPETIPKGG